MANPEHLAILRKGVKTWNEWRKDNREVTPDLSGADISGANLSDADLYNADLIMANLSGADLNGADLSGAILTGADLSKAGLSKADLYKAELIGTDLGGAILTGADLRGAILTGADLRGAKLTGADLSGACPSKADLSFADLSGANLIGADLTRANLIETDLTGAKLLGADLSGANLIKTDLSGAKLGGANLLESTLTLAHLKEADLSGANLSEANLIGANFTGATLTRTEFGACAMGGTNFCSNDLSEATGIDNITHISPSAIGIDTLYRSNGRIPDQFLRDAGVPEEVIDLARSIRCGPPIQWHSCFISYSTTDEEFARRLHSRMREANLRVWFAPEDVKGGKKLHEQLFEAIQLQDKLLLVLSEASMQSEWVTTEIRKARQIEKKENRRKLFPIRLVDFDAIRGWTCFDADTGKDLAVELREYFIPDFSNWKDHDAFEREFGKLLKDLRADGGTAKAEDPSPKS